MKFLGKDAFQWFKWFITDGDNYTKFKEYINSEDPSILEFLRHYKLQDAKENDIDFLHMLATLGAEYNDFFDPNLAGWAGDLQSFIRDLKIVTYGKNYNSKELSNEAYKIITNYLNYNDKIKDPKFPKPDLLADIDAKNISCIYNKSKYISFMIKDYYTIHYKSRFNEFRNNMGGDDQLWKLVTEYTQSSYNRQHLLLHYFAYKAANRADIKSIYLNSYVSSETGDGVDSPIYITYSLIDPQIVTVSESTALKEVFKRLIEEGLNEENKNSF